MIIELPVNNGKNTCGIDPYSVSAVLPNYSNDSCCSVKYSVGNTVFSLSVSLSVFDTISIINKALYNA